MCCRGREEKIKREKGEGCRMSGGWEVVVGGAVVVCGGE